MIRKVRGRLTIAAGIAAALVGPAQPAPAAETGPAPDINPVLKKMGVMVGGRWVTQFKNDKGEPIGELRFRWAEGGNAIVGEGVLGIGTAHPVQVRSTVGWDPVAKKVYYLDSHGTDTVYFGYYREEGDGMVCEFKSIVGSPGAWVNRFSYVDQNTYKGEMRQVVDGKPTGEGHVIQLTRMP